MGETIPENLQPVPSSNPGIPIKIWVFFLIALTTLIVVIAAVIYFAAFQTKSVKQESPPTTTTNNRQDIENIGLCMYHDEDFIVPDEDFSIGSEADGVSVTIPKGVIGDKPGVVKITCISTGSGGNDAPYQIPTPVYKPLVLISLYVAIIDYNTGKDIQVTNPSSPAHLEVWVNLVGTGVTPDKVLLIRSSDNTPVANTKIEPTANKGIFRVSADINSFESYDVVARR